MERRDFLRFLAVVGGSSTLAPLLSRCAPDDTVAELDATVTASPAPVATGSATSQATPQVSPPTTEATATATPDPSPTASPEPTATPDPRLATVALVPTRDRAAGVARALDLLGVNPVSGKRVLLKPNFNSADVAPGSTHPDVLRALIRRLQRWGAAAITVADRSGMGDTRQVMAQKGVFDLASELGFDVVVLDELPESAWTLYRPPDSHWADGFPVPRLLLDADCVVQTCNLKTHRYGGHFTLSLKNSVGFVAKFAGSGSPNYMSELHNSPYQRQMIAEINAAYAPDLIVLDGVEAFVSGGPDVGEKVAPEVVLAASDRVALDAVGVAILRLFGTTPEVSRGRVFEQEQITRAAALGLGVAAPDLIDLVTDHPDGEAYAQRIREVLLG
jgi:uncharacterized protein (DUF362 family)